MSDGEIRDYRVEARSGEFYTLRMRVKCRCIEDGVEGILFAMLHPDTLTEVGEYWAPVASNPGLGALSNGRE
jgi:hypothetical protein